MNVTNKPMALTVAECDEIVAACRADAPGIPILPSPGGGMTPDRMPDLAAAYGPDTVYLLGGSLLRAGQGLASMIRKLRDDLDRAAEE